MQCFDGFEVGAHWIILTNEVHIVLGQNDNKIIVFLEVMYNAPKSECSRVCTRPKILEKLWKIGRSKSRTGKVMEKCNFFVQEV